MKLSSIASAAKSIFSFASQPVQADSGGGPAARLYQDEAVDALIRYVTQIPDLDEVLRQAGIPRDRLRVLLHDDEIYQACETRLDALLAVPMRFEPSEGPEVEFLEETLKPFIEGAMSAAFKARLFGYSVMEAVYKQTDDSRIGLQYLGEKPMQWFEPKADGRLIYRANDGSGGSYGIEVNQTFKFFLTRSRPTYEQPYGEALLSRLYWPWFFRSNGWRFWGKFLERFGSPLLVGKSGDPQKMVDALLQAHSQAVMGVGPNDSVEAVGPTGSNNGEAFNSFESAVIRRIQKVVLGQTLTSGTDGGSGNRALGQVHDAVRLDKRDSDISMVQATIQRVVDALCQLNGFKAVEVMFADETGLEADRAARDKTLHEIGVRFEANYFEDNYGLNRGDFTLSSEAATGGNSPPLDPVSGDPVPEGADDQDPPPVPGSVKAAQGPLSFSSRGGLGRVAFTKQQQVIEQQADAALAAAGQPLSSEKIRAAVLAASDPDDLKQRLFALIGEDVAEADFVATLEHALYAADVLGYVHAEGKT